jgi:ketosteroid isomerase-like protein
MDEYVSVFTDDAVMEIPGYPSRTGIEGLRNSAMAGREGGAFGPGSNTMHFLGTTTVEVGVDEASSYTAFVMFKETASSPTPASAGRYFDTFRRTAEGWRIAHRLVQLG